MACRFSCNKAKENFCRVWGVICASAVNQDGRSVTPITKPSQNQQEILLQSIYRTIDPSAVQYVEAHGTGTSVGDPVEAASIGNIIGKNRSSELMPLKIGSVKGNIGHTESAAGIAGLIKVLLMMHHKVIPPSLHYTKELSIIKLEEFRFTIPVYSKTWEDPGHFGRMAGINSFGFGGTNAHVVLKQHKHKYSHCSSKRPAEVFIISAFSSKSLKLVIADTIERLNKITSLSLQNVVYTSACRRSHSNYKYRKAFLATSLTHLQQQLASSANTEIAPIKESPRILFVFCGNGVNYKGMCKMLLRYEPVFRNKCIEIDEILQVYTPLSILDLLESEYDDFSRPEIAQPMLFTIQVSLVALLRHWGVKPDTIIGHSVGEVAAAHCAGQLSLQDAVKVIYYRSMLQAKVTGGKMLVVSNIPVTDIARVIQPYSGKICIAAYNSPTSCTLSGDAKSIEQIHDQLIQANNKGDTFLLLHLLDVPAAYHSHLMDTILEEIKENLQNLAVKYRQTDLISTVTGKIASQGDFTTGEYWARNIREPVAFEQALRASDKSKEKAFFIEIGPRRALQRYIKDVLGQHNVVLPVVHPSAEYETLFTLLKTLFTEGYNPDWNNIYEAYKSAPADIPQYHFDHKKQEINYETFRQGNQSVAITHSLLQGVNEDMTEFTCSVSEATTPYIYDHKNNGSVIVPGSFYVELGLAASIINMKPKIPLSSLEISIEFSSPCVVSQKSIDLKIKIEKNNNLTHFEILTSHVFAQGRVQKKNGNLHELKTISLQHIFQRCKLVYKKDEIYDELSRFGFQYGDVYKQLSDIHYSRDLNEGITEMKLSEELKEEMHEYYIHPVVLDCFLQMIACLAKENKESVIFPSAIGSLTIIRPLQEKMFAYAKQVNKTENYLELCGCFTDENGFVLAEIKNARLTFVREQSPKTANVFFQNSWKRALEPASMNKPEQEPKILVFADLSGIGQQLQKHINGLNFIFHNNWDSDDTKLKTVNILTSEYSDVLFMWGIQKVQKEFKLTLTQYLAKCCEVYQQVILAVREKNPKASIRTITFRTTENTVDNINPGFVFVGMTRACITEMTDMSFQLIDISSSSPNTLESLAKVIQHYKTTEFPEIRIHEGDIYESEISHSTNDVEDFRKYAVSLKRTDNFTLFSEDPYKLAELSAEVTDSKITELTNKNVEVEIDEISIHTEDYFPVSLSSYQYANTLYWKTLTNCKHKLLALDFTATVKAVGKDVRKLRVGDHIVSCYPIVASSRVVLPESVCYPLKKVPTLQNMPCISHLILAWEVLHQLPKAKNKPKLSIVTSETQSILCQIISKTVKGRGWELTEYADRCTNVKQCSAMIILPPTDVIFEEDLSHLLMLKDLVIICDRKNLYGFQNLAEICRGDVHIHVLNPNAIFQKAHIKDTAKYIYKWIKSMHGELFQSVHCSVLTERINHMAVTDKSYFTEKCLPLFELDKNKIPNVQLPMTQQTLFQQDAVYIISGGLSGLGFETVKFILQHGGQNIVTLSRRKPTPEMGQELQRILNEQKNRRIIPLQCNVTDNSDVMRVMDYILKIFPKTPIKGFFHSAVVLHDEILPHLNQSLYEKVLSPKVEGTVNLHQATLNMDLDYFVCYSSIASFLGNPGQANYAAANSFLDLFCQYRRNLGLSGHSISWSALNLGLLSNRHNVQELLQARGILVLQTQEVHEYLEKSLMINKPHQVIARFDFEIIDTKSLALKKRFYNIVAKETRRLNKTVVASSKKPTIKAEDYIMSLVSELSGVSSNEISMNDLLTSLGFDSMLSMTIQNRIFKEKEINIPPVKLLDPSTSVSMLVSMIKENSCDTKEDFTDTILEATRL